MSSCFTNATREGRGNKSKRNPVAFDSEAKGCCFSGPRPLGGVVLRKSHSSSLPAIPFLFLFFANTSKARERLRNHPPIPWPFALLRFRILSFSSLFFISFPRFAFYGDLSWSVNPLVGLTWQGYRERLWFNGPKGLPKLRTVARIGQRQGRIMLLVTCVRCKGMLWRCLIIIAPFPTR